MAYKSGYIPLSALRTVAPGIQLIGSAAQAYLNMQLMYKMIDGTKVTPAGKGAGYRNWATALEFYKAGQGNLALREKWDIDPHLQVSIAYPPGSHGPGNRLDMLFNGRSCDAGDIEFAARYGWTREFGDKDRNHFEHDGITAVHGVRGYDKLRILGRYYNSRHLGRTTHASESGKWDADLIWLAQHAGHIDGTYPKACVEDGITGPNTQRSIDKRWTALKNAA